MPKRPKLTESNLYPLFDEAYFRRGQNYFHSGAIFDVALREGQLSGSCNGSRHTPYQVSVFFKGNTITATDCSCPIGGGCKHVVALLLTWVHHPEEFEVRIPVAETLKGRDRNELIAIIEEMISREPQLENILYLPLPGASEVAKSSLSAAAIKREVGHALDLAHDSWRGTADCIMALSQINDLGNRYANAQDWENALAVYQTLIEEVLDVYEDLYDNEGDILHEVGNAAWQLSQCLPKVEQAIELHQAVVKTLFFVVSSDIRHGGTGLSNDITDQLMAYTTPEERQWLRHQILARLAPLKEQVDFSSKWAKKAWGGTLLSLDEADGDISGFLQCATTYGLHESLFNKLLALERVPEAVQLAQEHLRQSDYQFLQMAQKLEDEGFVEEAVDMVMPYIDEIGDSRLLEWLAKHATKQPELALRLQKLQWLDRPTVELYKKIKVAAQKLGSWPATQKQLLEPLTDDYSVLKANIYLLEEEWAKAWKTAQKIPPFAPYSTKNKVAAAVIDHFPEEVTTYYLECAERLINDRGRSNYVAATEYLQRLKTYYLQTGEVELWEATIAVIREDFKRLSALREELDKAAL